MRKMIVLCVITLVYSLLLTGTANAQPHSGKKLPIWAHWHAPIQAIQLAQFIIDEVAIVDGEKFCDEKGKNCVTEKRPVIYQYRYTVFADIAVNKAGRPLKNPDATEEKKIKECAIKAREKALYALKAILYRSVAEQNKYLVSHEVPFITELANCMKTQGMAKFTGPGMPVKFYTERVRI